MEKISESECPLYLSDKGIRGPSSGKIKLDKSTFKRRDDFLSRRALNNNTVCLVKDVTGRDV